MLLFNAPSELRSAVNETWRSEGNRNSAAKRAGTTDKFEDECR